MFFLFEKEVGRQQEENLQTWSLSVLLSFHPYSLGCQTDKRTTATQKLSTTHAHYLLSPVSEMKTLSQLHKNNLVLQSLHLTLIP